MKKLLFVFLVLSFKLTVWAQISFFVDGIWYTTTGMNTVSVSRDVNYSGLITIPSTVVNSNITYSVTSIGKVAS
jgi:hypothetical protein